MPASSEKYYIPDHLKKGTVRNKGEVDSYYMEDNHSAIVTREMWKQVQEKIERRGIAKGFVDRRLPEGFSLITLESADLQKLKLCTHREFKNDGEPVFLTKNGRGRYVLVDIEEYERQ